MERSSDLQKLCTLLKVEYAMLPMKNCYFCLQTADSKHPYHANNLYISVTYRTFTPDEYVAGLSNEQYKSDRVPKINDA